MQVPDKDERSGFDVTVEGVITERAEPSRRLMASPFAPTRRGPNHDPALWG
jgi:hypothetical protein